MRFMEREGEGGGGMFFCHFGCLFREKRKKLFSPFAEQEMLLEASLLSEQLLVHNYRVSKDCQTSMYVVSAEMDSGHCNVAIFATLY